MAKKKEKLIKKEDKASLSNILNEMMYEEKMTLSELRFFLVYLSKINPKNPSETEITFQLEDVAEILGVELNEALVDKITRKMLRYVVRVRPKVLDDDVIEDFRYVQLFSESRLYKKRLNNKWYLTFTCHEKIKEHLFELKSSFTSLEVWNIINLRSFQDARLYMLLRQYKHIGERTVDIKELKKMLGIDIDAYPEYKIFARDVLKKSQKNLKQCTDIEFDFHAVGRPARAVYFEIRSNIDYELPKFLTDSKEELPKLLPAADEVPVEPVFNPLDPASPDMQRTYVNEVIDFIAGACKYEFDGHQMQLLLNFMADAGIGSGLSIEDQKQAKYDYLHSCYSILNFNDKAGNIKTDRFRYLCGIVKNSHKNK